MNRSEYMKLNEGARYWEERCREDPRAWTKHCLRCFGFSQEEVARIERERIFLDQDKAHRDGDRLMASIRAQARRDQREIRRLNILIHQGLIKLMRKEGWTDEAIDETMAAFSN